MIEVLPDLPPATVGFRASGKLTADDYRDTLLPVIREHLNQGKLNLIFETAPDFSGLELGALWEDAKAGATLAVKHHSDWGRIALVTDAGWLRKSLTAFAWMSPGEPRVFDAGEVEAAKAWIAEGS